MENKTDDNRPSRREQRLREEQLLKRPPDVQKLEETMRSSRLVMGGFLGPDKRALYDIIEEDVSTLGRLGYLAEEVASRMRQLTHLGAQGLGTSVTVEGRFEVTIEEHKGLNVCPWPHGGGVRKRITTVRRLDSGKVLRWTDLGVHMIQHHGFFEGRGSLYRLEPRELVENIF